MMIRLVISSFISLLVLLLSLSYSSACFAATDLCKQYAVEKEYDKAVEECTKQINGEIPVKHLEYSYSNRGAAYANKEQYDEAISDYTKAIELSPKDSAAYVGRATALANKKLYDQAIMDFTMAIELNPEDSAAYRDRAMVYARKKQFAQTVSDRDKAVEPSAKASWAASHENPPAANQARKATYHIQLGVSKNKKNATVLAKRFKKKGYDAFIIKSQKGKTMRYRVLIGEFEDRHSSEKLAAKIRKKEKIATTIFSE